MKTTPISRRKFIQNTALTAGMAPVTSFAASSGLTKPAISEKKSPREVWIAGVSQAGLRAKTPEEMTDKIMEALDRVVVYKPDFVCLPETFPFEYVDNQYPLKERIPVSEKVLEKFSAFSGKNNCYTICPVYTSENGRIFNSAVVFNRDGKRIGKYDKIHETVGMIESGVTCGSLIQPVIMTDFGPVGIQICYDVNWEDGWRMLREQGAEIIFWCSAFDGGRRLNMKALQYQCVVASATNKNTAGLIDISGITITKTGIWDPNFYCGCVNLEKVFVPTYQSLKQLGGIVKKYGRRVRLTTLHEEEWTIIESLSPGLFVNDILKEFNLKSDRDSLKEAEIIQTNFRK
jgi:predicted amidohydrolase